MKFNIDKSLFLHFAGLLFFVLSFILVNGSDNKLIVGGLILIYLGIAYLFEDELTLRDLSKYLGVLLLTLGSVALLTSYLLPEKVNLFVLIVLGIIFAEWILLHFVGPKIWFKNLLFVMFLLPVSVTAWSIMSDSFRIGISQLASTNWILLSFSIIVIVLIYNSLMIFLSKLFPNNKNIKKMASTRSSIIFTVILIIVSGIGFYYRDLGINEILKIANSPWVIIFGILISVVSLLRK